MSKHSWLRPASLAARSHTRRDDADAFLPDPAVSRGTFFSRDTPSRDRPSRRQLAVAADVEADAEEFIASATSAYSVVEEARNELSMDEIGGPFLDDLD